MDQIAATGAKILTHILNAGTPSRPGQEQDLAVILTSYAMTSAALLDLHGDAGHESRRQLRTKMKSVLLAVLRKHYLHGVAAEHQLGASMIAQVDELLDSADGAVSEAMVKIKSGDRHALQALHARLDAILKADANASGDLPDAHVEFLSAQYQAIRSALKSVR